MADGRSQRAGTYIRQPNGYEAFQPIELKNGLQITLDAELIRLLSAADRALAALDSVILMLPDPDRFVLAYVRKEAVLSSQIEGTQSSLNDLLKAEAKIDDPSRPSDVDEVVNYVAAMKYGLERLATLPTSSRLIRELHERLMQGVRGGEKNPGQFRRDQVWIGPANTPITRAVFVPPPWQNVEPAIADLETYFHIADETPPLIRIGVAHAQFETIHPFNDGNGRIGRLLITFLLCESGLLHKPVLYLSNFLRANRQEYYDRLQAIRDKGEWESWLKFFLQGVAQVATEAVVLARNIVELRERYRSLVATEFGSQSGTSFQLLEYLFSHPFTTVNRVRDVLDVHYVIANKIVNRFVASGILMEITGNSRNRLFAFREYLKLLSP